MKKYYAIIDAAAYKVEKSLTAFLEQFEKDNKIEIENTTPRRCANSDHQIILEIVCK